MSTIASTTCNRPQPTVTPTTSQTTLAVATPAPVPERTSKVREDYYRDTFEAAPTRCSSGGRTNISAPVNSDELIGNSVPHGTAGGPMTLV